MDSSPGCNSCTRLVKGQLVFEFIVAAILFMGIVVFALNILNTNVFLFTEDYLRHNLDEKAIAASEALVKTRGGVIGLAREWPVLDRGKIDSLRGNCTGVSGSPNPVGYHVLGTELSLLEKPGGIRRGYDMRILITEIPSLTTLVDCKLEDPTNVATGHSRRIAIDETGTLLELAVWVW